LGGYCCPNGYWINSNANSGRIFLYHPAATATTTGLTSIGLTAPAPARNDQHL
jgi:hypothetical protein